MSISTSTATAALADGKVTFRRPTKVIQCLLGIRIDNRLWRAFLKLMEEQPVELGMRPFDLTAVHSFTPIEHVHEEICIGRNRFHSIRENLNFSLSKREERRVDR